MIVLPDTTTFDSCIRLVQLVGGATKVNMLKVCDKLDLYVCPNLKKDETARRVAQELLDNPIEILSNLHMSLQVIDSNKRKAKNTSFLYFRMLFMMMTKNIYQIVNNHNKFVTTQYIGTRKSAYIKWDALI